MVRKGFIEGLRAVAWKKLGAWAAVLALAVGSMGLTLGRAGWDSAVGAARPVQRHERRLDSLEKNLEEIGRKADEKKKQDENVLVAQMLANPAFTREMKRMADRRDSARGAEDSARAIIRRLSGDR